MPSLLPRRVKVALFVCVCVCVSATRANVNCAAVVYDLCFCGGRKYTFVGSVRLLYCVIVFVQREREGKSILSAVLCV